MYVVVSRRLGDEAGRWVSKTVFSDLNKALEEAENLSKQNSRDGERNRRVYHVCAILYRVETELREITHSDTTEIGYKLYAAELNRKQEEIQKRSKSHLSWAFPMRHKAT